MRKTDAYNAHPEVIAIALAFLCGVICLGMGLLRIGFIIEFIPTPAVAGFMTGSAIQIAAGQVPKLLGLNAVNTNGNPAYRIIIDTLKGLPKTNINAAFGLPALFFLYFIKWFCGWLPSRYPRTARTMFFVSVLRNAFVIIVLTIASRIWLGSYPHNYKKYPISVLGPVPRGFKHIGQPNLDTQLPLGHCSSAARLGRHPASRAHRHRQVVRPSQQLQDQPNQELIAIGVTNLIGPCFGAYAATGFLLPYRYQVQVRCAHSLGWLVHRYPRAHRHLCAQRDFLLDPNPVLSAVIIHAVTDLVVPFPVSYKFWLISPFELVIFLGAVFATVFSNTENGVYVSVAASLALLLIRIARPRGKWLGLVRVHHGTTDS